MKLSIHRALAELKTIDARIEKAIYGIVPSGYTLGQDGKVQGIHDKVEFEKDVRASFDSIKDLIARKLVLKTAIAKSNATTYVTIGSKSMLVIDAINTRQVLASKKQLIGELKAKHNQVTATFKKNQEIVQANLQKLLEVALGKDNVKSNEADVKNISDPYLAKNKIELFDPLNIADRIKELEKEVSDFELNVDAALSESNAVTLIDDGVNEEIF